MPYDSSEVGVALCDIIGQTGKKESTAKVQGVLFLQGKKPRPHFTPTGNSQLLAKTVQKKGPTSQKLLVKQIPSKIWACSKPHKDHAN